MGRASRRKRGRRAAEERWGTRREETTEGTSIHWDPSSPAGAEIDSMLAEQAAAFRQKFGREPGPNDPLVFDPEADEPQPMPVENIEAATVEAMRSAGLDDAYIYAYQVTGLMPTEMNRHLLTDDDIAEFEEAIAKYQALHER